MIENHGDRRSVDRDLINEIVQIAVHETLMQLGIDTDDPKAHQADMMYLRRQREFQEGAKKHTTYGVILLAAVASLGWLIPAILNSLKEAIK